MAGIGFNLDQDAGAAFGADLEILPFQLRIGVVQAQAGRYGVPQRFLSRHQVIEVEQLGSETDECNAHSQAAWTWALYFLLTLQCW